MTKQNPAEAGTQTSETTDQPSLAQELLEVLGLAYEYLHAEDVKNAAANMAGEVRERKLTRRVREVAGRVYDAASEENTGTGDELSGVQG